MTYLVTFKPKYIDIHLNDSINNFYSDIEIYLCYMQLSCFIIFDKHVYLKFKKSK